MEEVELQLEVGRPHLLDDPPPVALVVEEIARDRARVDRLDEHRDAQRRRLLRRQRHVRQIGAGEGLAVVLGTDQPGHAMQPLRPDHLGIMQRLVQPVPELRLAPRQCRDPPLALGEIARRQVEERLLQPGIVQRLADRLWRMLIRKEILDTLEPGGGRSRKALEKRHLGEHHAEIGGKTRHARDPSPFVAAPQADRLDAPADCVLASTGEPLHPARSRARPACYARKQL